MVVFEIVPKLLSPRLSASEAAMTCTELSRLRAVCHRVFLLSLEVRRAADDADIFSFCSPMLSHVSRYDGPSRRVYMYFHFRGDWQVRFLEADLRTPLLRVLTFTDPDKVRELGLETPGN
jgi:hypothetical protein